MQSNRTLQNQPIRCRICLEDDLTGMISPCNCSGSVGNIHISCLQTWIEKERKYNPQKIKKVSEEVSKIDCQICKGKIQFEFKTEVKCVSCTEFKEIVNDNCCSFFCVLLWIIIFTTTSAILAYSIVKAIIHQNELLTIIIFLVFFFVNFTILLKMVQALISPLVVQKMTQIKIKHKIRY